VEKWHKKLSFFSKKNSQNIGLGRSDRDFCLPATYSNLINLRIPDGGCKVNVRLHGAREMVSAEHIYFKMWAATCTEFVDFNDSTVSLSLGTIEP
jgi:hypothetical protein